MFYLLSTPILLKPYFKVPGKYFLNFQPVLIFKIFTYKRLVFRNFLFITLESVTMLLFQRYRTSSHDLNLEKVFRHNKNSKSGILGVVIFCFFLIELPYLASGGL
jgi:hypothetical protein